jgi:MFS family permease
VQLCRGDSLPAAGEDAAGMDTDGAVAGMPGQDLPELAHAAPGKNSPVPLLSAYRDRTYLRFIFFVWMNALSFGLLAIGPYLWVAVISMLSITFGEMMSMPFMNSYWISRSSLQNRGQYAALYGIAYSAAQVIAPALGGQVAQHWGFSWLWAILVGGAS